MTSWSRFRKSARVLREQLGWRRFLKLADPFLARSVDPIDQMGQPESILIIAPHPDDEAIGCGGAIALHRKRGDAVHILYTTDGGRPARGAPMDPNQPATRRNEGLRGLDMLGGATQEFLDMEDGKGDITDTGVKAIAKAIEAKKPNRIYVPWMLDNHRDHKAAFEMLRRALKGSIPADTVIWQYEVWTPLVANRYVPIASVLDVKEKAIRAHESQMKSHDYVSASVGLAHYRGLQGGIEAPAEAFFAVPAGKLELFSEL